MYQRLSPKATWNRRTVSRQRGTDRNRQYPGLRLPTLLNDLAGDLGAMQKRLIVTLILDKDRLCITIVTGDDGVRFNTSRLNDGSELMDYEGNMYCYATYHPHLVTAEVTEDLTLFMVIL